MSGAFEAIVDIGSSFIGEIGSIVTDFGTEFASSLGGLDFGISLDSIADFGGFEQIGSFAGNAGWFDAFNPGDIISSVSSVAESSSGFFSSFSLPSLSDIKSIASTVQSDFGGFIRDAQAFSKVVQDVAPLVSVASSAFGIQNPIAQIAQPLSLVTGIGGIAAGVAGSVASASLPSLSDIKQIAGSVQDFSGFVQGAQQISGLVQQTAPLVNLASTAFGVPNPIAQITQPLNLAAGIAGTAAGFAGTLNELSDAEIDSIIRRNVAPGLINNFADPTVQSQVNRLVALNATQEALRTNPDAVVTPAPSQFLSFYDPESATWSVFDTATNDTVQSGLTEQQAILSEQDLNISADGITLNSSTTVDEDPFEARRLEIEREFDEPAPTEADILNAENSRTSALTTEARNGQTIRSLRNTKAQSSDWRVKLSLAPNSNYLYNDPRPGLLAPLSSNGGTGGVIFPYTPSIETAYKANYDTYDLTHSNYRGYFYKNSYVDAVNLRATFTAQDTNEANYLLAVIHFFRSVTKMFYGQKTDQRGAPPPLVYIKGYGDFQFNNHPCLVSQFNYSLPPDVDYIRAQSVLNNNTNLQLARLRNPIANNPLSYSVNRILNSGLLPGALDFRPPIANNLGVGNPTYVPTKMEISVSLLPIQSRQQVSKNFSIGGFADGSLLSGGFW